MGRTAGLQDVIDKDGQALHVSQHHLTKLAALSG